MPSVMLSTSGATIGASCAALFTNKRHLRRGGNATSIGHSNGCRVLTNSQTRLGPHSPGIAAAVGGDSTAAAADFKVAATDGHRGNHRVAVTGAGDGKCPGTGQCITVSLCIMGIILEKGNIEVARNYIKVSSELLAETVVKRWCVNPILDAVFSAYFRQAEACGIRIEADIDIPEDLPVDAAELSTVFANALENAIHAVKQLPSEQRVIRCKYIRHPQLMFRVANPSTKEKFPLTSLDALSTPAIPTALAPAALLPTAKNTAPSVSTEPEMAGLPYRSSSRFGLTVFIRLHKNERPPAMHKG